MSGYPKLGHLICNTKKVFSIQLITDMELKSKENKSEIKAIPTIHECLRKIGMKEVGAGIYSYSVSKSKANK